MHCPFLLLVLLLFQQTPHVGMKMSGKPASLCVPVCPYPFLSILRALCKYFLSLDNNQEGERVCVQGGANPPPLPWGGAAENQAVGLIIYLFILFARGLKLTSVPLSGACGENVNFGVRTGRRFAGEGMNVGSWGEGEKKKLRTESGW